MSASERQGTTPRVIAIVGSTASGKSSLALAAARVAASGGAAAGAAASAGIEVVAADAMQIYRGMDIGTAKPTAIERAEVPHHAIDLFDPWEDGSVTAYAGHARRALSAVGARGHVALVVGGTGLYVRALVDQLAPPGQWPELRAELDAMAGAAGTRSLHARLAALDPVAAAKMEPTNTRRVVRALEVCLGSGRPFSSFGPGLGQYPPTSVHQIALAWPRPRLAARIEHRVHQMVGAGLVDEVNGLLTAPSGLSRTARQALGYKEVIDHLEGRASLDEAIATVIVRTRQFAVRQERWFRRDERIRFVAVADDPLEALPVLLAAMDR